MEHQKPVDLRGPQDGQNLQVSWKGNFLTAIMTTDVGRKRDNNEDSCVIHVPADEMLLDSRGLFFGVADGMGGASAGEFASCKALEYSCKSYYDKNIHALVPAALRKAVETANLFLYKESERVAEYSGMGTTLSALAILGNWGYIAQIGDSRVYLQRKGKQIQQITDDHSLVAEQVKSGLIDKEEANNHSLKNLITRAVGIGEEIDVDLFAVNLQKEDTLLICSDGLCNMVEDEDLDNYMHSDTVEEAAEKMLQHALDAGGTDNITFTLIRVHDTPPITNYQQGAKVYPAGKRGFFSRLFRRG